MSETSTARKTIAFLLYPGLTPLDLVGPLQVLSALQDISRDYRVTVVSEHLQPVGTDIDVQMVGDACFTDVHEPFAIVVPGGGLPTLRAMSQPGIRQYLRQTAGSAEIVASVCTGSLLLGAVGLLEGRQATTHWAYYRLLESYGATYLRQRWVEDGKFIMSAGVSAGIDMALHLTARLTEEQTAKQVQSAIDYDPKPPFGRIDWNSMGFLPRMKRAALSKAAPFLTRRARRLTSQGL